MTNNLEKRLKQHNNAENRSTKAYIPFEMFYLQEFENREQARKREVYLKSGIGKEYLRNLLK